MASEDFGIVGAMYMVGIENDFLILLQDIRKSPRKMHKSYLVKIGVYDRICDIIPDNNYTIKEKIDIILLDEYTRCSCGKLSKPRSKWCSIQCRNRDPNIRKNIKEKNTKNQKERLRKAKETRLERYGVEAVQDIPTVKLKTKLKKQEYYNKVINDTFRKYNLDINKLSDHEYLREICDNNSAFEVMRKYFNNIPYTTMIRHFSRIGFDPKFSDGGISEGEKDMLNWLSKEIDEEIISNNRSIIGKELDIYVPSKKLAIEFHGLYWHSDKILSAKGTDGRNYHKNKFQLCKDNDITLLQFFEDEWYFKRDIVQSMILSKLGKHDKKYFARKLDIRKVGAEDANDFLDKNHIQGFCVGSSYGLWDNEELVCMITIGKSRFDSSTELLRFCSKLRCRVVGGLSRLISYVKKKYDINEITTYADLRYSTGESYRNIGKFIKETEVGYYWINNYKRLNRFSTQKHKLAKLLNKKIDMNKTEKEIMEENNYIKLHDCGNYKFVI